MVTMDGKHMTKDETIKQLIEDLISAMEYHVEQTRPVHTTTVAIQAAKDALNSMPTASVQDQIKAITQEAMWKIHDLEYQARREVYNIPPAAPVQKRPQNCGTSYCSCIECVMEPAPVQEPVAWWNRDYGSPVFGFKRDTPGIGLGNPDATPLYTSLPTPVVPDVLTTAEGEHPEYVQGWNDCRQLMLQTRNNRHD